MSVRLRKCRPAGAQHLAAVWVQAVLSKDTLSHGPAGTVTEAGKSHWCLHGACKRWSRTPAPSLAIYAALTACPHTKAISLMHAGTLVLQNTSPASSGQSMPARPQDGGAWPA